MKKKEVKIEEEKIEAVPETPVEVPAIQPKSEQGMAEYGNRP